MNRLKKLQDRKAVLVAAMKGINEQANGETLTAEQSAAFKGHETELAEVNANIAREQLLIEAEKSLTVVVDPNSPAKSLAMPAVPVRCSSLRAFKGKDAELRAYRMGQGIAAHVFGNRKALAYCQDHGIKSLAHGENTNTAGGFFVHDEFSQTVIDLREEYGVFRANAEVMPMGSDSLVINRRASGLTAYFVAEAGSITESTMGWDAVTLNAKKIAALARWSTELAEDAVINLADTLAAEMAYAFSLKEDQCGFTGDGTSTYAGIQGVMTKLTTSTTTNGATSGGIQIAAAGGTSYGALVLADFEKLMGILPQYAAQRGPKWYMSRPAFYASCARLMDAGGGNTNAALGAGVNPSFLGYPVVFSQVMNTTLAAQASTNVILFGALQLAATVGDRRGVTVETSKDLYFATDQIAIRGTERFDINCHDVGDSTTAGPVVILKTSAT